jgi:hypothetical protein
MEIRILSKHGKGVREIAREVGVSRNTVRRCSPYVIPTERGGKTSAAMSEALGGRASANDAAADDTGPDPEDTVNEALERRILRLRTVFVC